MNPRQDHRQSFAMTAAQLRKTLQCPCIIWLRDIDAGVKWVNAGTQIVD